VTAQKNSQTNKDARPRPTPLEDIGRRVDDEIEQMISYINDEVVPAVRGHSSRALRTAAEQLSKFADYMDRQRKSGS
jgi:hypothetical protein